MVGIFLSSGFLKFPKLEPTSQSRVETQIAGLHLQSFQLGGRSGMV